jgi:phosphatidate phosphatase APP1
MSILVAALLLPSAARAAAPAWIEIYSGWATPTGGTLVGRVHDGPRPVDPKAGESSRKRFGETIDALEAKPLVGVAVTVLIEKQQVAGRTDGRGYFDIVLPAHLPGPKLHVQVTLAEPGYMAENATADLAVFTDGPGLGVISDVDDTLLDTGVTHRARMIEHTLFRSSYELRSFDGAASTLSAVAADDKGRRPLVYVSGSPWGLHRRIADYFARSGFPDAPFVLKRFSSEPLTDQMAYKWPHTITLADSLPGRRWICFGDSSEKDPELYARLARERKGKVEAIYIHLVTDEKPDSPRFAGMFVFRNWSEAAADLLRRKLIAK